MILTGSAEKTEQPFMVFLSFSRFSALYSQRSGQKSSPTPPPLTLATSAHSWHSITVRLYHFKKKHIPVMVRLIFKV